MNHVCRKRGPETNPMWKTISTTPTPHISKKWWPQNMPFCRIKGLSQTLMAYEPDFYGIRTPTFMAHGPFFWWWGWSWICSQKGVYVCVYIYICAVGSISSPHLGFFRVNKWSTWSGHWVIHIIFPIRRKVVSDYFCKQSLQRGDQFFRRFLVLWFKSRVFKKGMVAIPFFIFLLWWLLVEASTRL